MKPATIAELKKAIVKLDQGELLELCLRLARFKVDNKELLTYLLFLADDEPAYAKRLCEEIDLTLQPGTFVYPKTIRKTVRWMNKCLRFSGNKETETEVRIHFCHALKSLASACASTKVVQNVLARELKRIHAAMEKLHDDLKADFRHAMADL